MSRDDHSEPQMATDSIDEAIQITLNLLELKSPEMNAFFFIQAGEREMLETRAIKDSHRNRPTLIKRTDRGNAVKEY
jgi:hypothetical protein